MKRPRRTDERAARQASLRQERVGARSSANGNPRDADRALWIGIVLLLALRAGVAFLPGMWAWGLDGLRFANPATGWGLWLASAVVCIPAVAGRGARWISRGIARLEGRTTLAVGVIALAVAGMCWLMVDRVWFLGDYILRLGAVEQGQAFGAFFPQALPLDILLQGTIPEHLGLRTVASIGTYLRVLGLLEAGGFVLLAAGFARALRLRGILALAVATIVVAGGALTMFTGYCKSAGEMCVVVLALAVFGIGSVRDPRHLLPLNVAAAAGFVLHRSSILLLPFVLAVWVLAWRTHGGNRLLRAPRGVLALAVPAATLFWILPRLLGLVLGFDLPMHLTPRGAPSGTSALGAALSPLHLADVANMLLAFSPLLVLAPSLAPVKTDRTSHRADGLLVSILAASFLPMLMFAHPQQGVFRDMDVFASAGVAASLLVAWLVARAFEDGPEREWLLVPLMLAAIAPAVLGLAMAHDIDCGLARARAYAEGPPARDVTTQSQVWEFIGLRCSRLGRWKDAESALRRATEAIPTPRATLKLALAATMSGDYATARHAYIELLSRNQRDPLSWLGLAGAAIRLRDSTTTRMAAERVAFYANDRASLASMKEFVRAHPEVWPHPLTDLTRR